jgi:hypothetical protein
MAREKSAHFFRERFPVPSLRSSARIGTNKNFRVKDLLLRGWDPEKAPRRLYVGEPRRLTYVQECL